MMSQQNSTSTMIIKNINQRQISSTNAKKLHGKKTVSFEKIQLKIPDWRPNLRSRNFWSSPETRRSGPESVALVFLHYR